MIQGDKQIGLQTCDDGNYYNPSDPGSVKKHSKKEKNACRGSVSGEGQMRYPVVQSARDGGQAPGWSGVRSSIGCRAECSDLMHHVLFKGHRLFPGSGVELTAAGWWTGMGRRGKAVNVVLPNHTAI